MIISFVGSGNVATHLARAFYAAGHEIAGIYSRSQAMAEMLARQVGAEAVTDVRHLPASDVYIFAVKDSVLPSLANQFAEIGGDSLLVHTAGSLPLSVFGRKVRHCAVLYPLQTFSKARVVDMRSVPCFVEGNNEESLRLVTDLARSISEHVEELDGDKRCYLHLSAVFACNFVNHCYAIAADILERQGLDARVLQPLIAETAAKARDMSPREAQTGPAVRFDQQVMSAHEKMLAGNVSRAAIYMLMSNSVHDFYQNKEKEDHDKL